MPPETLAGPRSPARDCSLFHVKHMTAWLLLVGLVKKWQKAENLVAPSTLAEIWTRHVADSAQLVALFPGARHWLDLGSGGGLSRAW